MSMEHKAFIFDYKAFVEQLSTILKNALLTGKNEALLNFINRNRDSLKDPYDGQALDFSWETMVEPKDAHQYGDFGLTKFYNPINNIGLGSDWQNIEKLLRNELGANLSFIVVLGQPFGTASHYFDPGKMGSYFQSIEQVKKNIYLLQNLVYQNPKLANELEELLKIFQQAVQAGKGLYITF